MRFITALAIATAITFSPGHARAVDFDQTLTQLDGTPFPDGKPEDARLRKIVVNALLAQYPDETGLSGEQKLTRFFLAKKVQDAKGDVKLSAEEIATIKPLIAKGYPALIVGQAWLLLDPASAAPSAPTNVKGRK